MSQTHISSSTQARCALYLLTPALSLKTLEAFTPRFAEALAAAPVASALVRVAKGSEGDVKAIASRLTAIAQQADCALLIEGDPRMAVRAGADGAHVAGIGPALSDALASLKPDRIVGVGGLRSRDDAMTAGEAGADYVMFGEARGESAPPPLGDVIERVAWWAEIFETPCVAYAPTIEAAGTLADAGADFVALGEAVWAAPSPPEALRSALALIRRAPR